jgi:hypothetical protein
MRYHGTCLCVVFLYNKNDLTYWRFPEDCLIKNKVSDKYLIKGLEEKAIPATKLWKILYDV